MPTQLRLRQNCPQPTICSRVCSNSRETTHSPPLTCSAAPAASEPLDPRPELNLPGPGAAVLLEQVKIGPGDGIRIEQESARPAAPPDRGSGLRRRSRYGRREYLSEQARGRCFGRGRAVRTCPSRRAPSRIPLHTRRSTRRGSPSPARSMRRAAACAIRKPPQAVTAIA